MTEMIKHGRVGLAAARSGMDRKTTRKYVNGVLPSALVKARDWKTRECPFSEEDRAWVETQLEASPSFEAKTLFEALRAHNPGAYEDGQLRTMQRLVKTWRALKGPEKMAFLAQQHRPGEAAQTDFTWANELNVTILGVAFAHMFCHFVLPFSNWQWVTVCTSESMAAITRGVQSALFRLGHIPTWHQTDNSTAATHLGSSGKRCFNDHGAFRDEEVAGGLEARGWIEDEGALKHVAKFADVAGPGMRHEARHFTIQLRVRAGIQSSEEFANQLWDALWFSRRAGIRTGRTSSR